MDDRARWELVGSVGRLRISRAAWSAAGDAWEAPRLAEAHVFRADGTLSASEQYAPDGAVAHTAWIRDHADRVIEVRHTSPGGDTTRTLSIYDRDRLVQTQYVAGAGHQPRVLETFSYDAAGRRTKVVALDGSAHTAIAIDGSSRGYGAPGAVSLTVQFDEHDRSIEAVFRDAGDAIVRRVTFTRDGAGRVLREEVRFGDAPSFPALPAVSSADDRARLATLLANTFTDAVLSTVSCTYDDRGRLVERVETMGQLSEERVTYRYDDRGHRIEQTSITHHRAMSLDAAGMPIASDNAPIEERHVMDYVYDWRGNWTERADSFRHPRTGAWLRVSLELREIMYLD